MSELLLKSVSAGLAPTDVEDVRLPEYNALLEALDRLEWEAGACQDQLLVVGFFAPGTEECIAVELDGDGAPVVLGRCTQSMRAARLLVEPYPTLGHIGA